MKFEIGDRVKLLQSAFDPKNYYPYAAWSRATSYRSHSGELVMCAKSGARCWENGRIRWLNGTLCGVEWLSDGVVSRVERRHLRRIENDVPSPPVAGMGVHAPAPCGAGAKTQQSPSENPEARRKRMSEPLKITKQTLLNGVPLSTLTKGQVLDQIKFQEDEIGRLEKIAHKPASLSKELDDRKAALSQLLEIVNAEDAAAKAAEPVTRAEFEAAIKK